MIFAITFWTWVRELPHPLAGGGGIGYAFYSGIGAGVGGWLGFGLTYLWRHNCHVHHCWRLSWHASETHGNHPVCKRHHPAHPSGGDHTHVIRAAGEAAKHERTRP